MNETGTLDAAELLAWLEAESAHHDLVRWVEVGSHAWPSAWDACPRGDWLIAIAHRAGTPSADLHRAALALADLVEDEIDHAGVRSALERLRKYFANTSVSSDVVRGLAEEFEQEAERAEDLSLALAYRVLALVGQSHADPAVAAFVPAHLVELVLAGAMDCAMMSLVSEMHRRTADIVRSSVAAPRLEPPQRRSESTGSSESNRTQ